MRAKADEFEKHQMFEAVPQMDAKLCELLAKGKTRKAIKAMTCYTVNTAQEQFEAWKALEELLLDFVAACADIATMEKNPKLEGRFMSIFLAPKNSK